MQPILSVPHDILRKKSVTIEKLDLTVQNQVQDLIDTIKNAHDPEGVGLSFPQIGLSLRGFVTYLEKRIKIYLNPVILDISDDLTLGGTKDRPTLEGCLSIPWLYGPVWRPKKIKIQALDEHGVEFVKTLSSFPARLAMHEYDHLEGVLFTDYTLRDGLPLYLLNHDSSKFVQIEDPATVIKW
jgi:peptide deformylase